MMPVFVMPVFVMPVFIIPVFMMPVFMMPVLGLNHLAEYSEANGRYWYCMGRKIRK